MANAKKLPEGYIAARSDAVTFAVDSATLAKNGDVHMSGFKAQPKTMLDAGETRALNEHVEFSIKSDPRLEKLKEKAEEIGARFKNIPDIREREKKITDALLPLVYETYGSYAHELKGGGKNTAEKNAKKWDYEQTVQLRDIPKGELVCRHYAPIMSVLLDKAGVPNHLVSSHVTRTGGHHGAYTLATNAEPGGHSYVVTQGGAIVEGTVAGTKYDSGNPVSAYRPILNGVGAKEIVYFGHAALTQGTLYGGHLGDGSGDLGKVKAGQKISLELYNDQVNGKTSPHISGATHVGKDSPPRLPNHTHGMQIIWQPRERN